MNKKEFLGASLHTGLKCNAVNDEYYAPQIAKELYRIETGKTEKSKSYDWFCVIGDIECKIDDVTPILRPLSDLTKPITHNGETFVPMVELAKIAFRSDGDNISESNCIITSEMMNNKPYNYMACFKTPHCMDENQLTTLVIYAGDLHFQHRQFVHGREHTHPVHNILDIILKLIEWHFNLMDKSEPFIPVTEEFNTYK